MQTLRTIREIDWKLVALAARRICTTLGAISLVSWFAVERHPVELTASVLFVATVWVMAYMAIRAYRVQFVSSPKSQRIGGHIARHEVRRHRSADGVGIHSPAALREVRTRLMGGIESADDEVVRGTLLACVSEIDATLGVGA